MTGLSTGSFLLASLLCRRTSAAWRGFVAQMGVGRLTLRSRGVVPAGSSCGPQPKKYKINCVHAPPVRRQRASKACVRARRASPHIPAVRASLMSACSAPHTMRRMTRASLRAHARPPHLRRPGAGGRSRSRARACAALGAPARARHARKRGGACAPQSVTGGLSRRAHRKRAFVRSSFSNPTRCAASSAACDVSMGHGPCLPRPSWCMGGSGCAPLCHIQARPAGLPFPCNDASHVLFVPLGLCDVAQSYISPRM